MGEWSKTVGERGEEVVGLFLKRLGWSSFQKGVKVDCTAAKHMNNENNKKQTHGIDFLFSYISPLSDDLFDTLAISSKYSAKPYPSNKATAFKAFYSDITETIACFRKSKAYIDHVGKFSATGQKRVIGVILWLTNTDASDSCTPDLVRTDILKSNDDYDAVYVVDNKTASFLYDAIGHVQLLEKDSETSFVYVDSGKYLNSVTRHFSGDVLPVEYVNLGLLPMKTTREGVATLTLCCASPFDPTKLGRLIGLSQSISQDWAAKIRILFEDYNPLKHENQVAEVKNAFQIKKVIDKLEVGTFQPTLLNATA